MALAAAASAGGPGSEVTTSTLSPEQPTAPTPAPTPAPRAVWRLLQMKGMTPDEAASLTAFLYGLPTTDLRWTLPQLNQLLFLQRLHQIGRFGGDDGDHKLPH
ncbi:MAG: hypothetical protein Q7S35_12535 [Candidatus Limnocylindrales bacterium]|nr:hypothetical protein [Candidatus Limnocylindrales bacterium]